MKRSAYTKKVLQGEMHRWASKGFAALSSMRARCSYSLRCGELGDFQVEVQVVEARNDYVQVVVAVDSGGMDALAPVAASFLVFADGTVDL